MPRTPARVAAALLVAGALGTGPTAPARASVLCKNLHGGLLVRDTCKSREVTLDVAKLDELGLRGPAGPVGPPGPAGGGLKVLDAIGSEVGLVTSLETGYYGGQSARIAREMTLPGGSGPEFIALAVSTAGLLTNSYACGAYYGFFTTPDCTGDVFQSCDGYGACSSASGAFLFQPVDVGTDGVACYARGGSEFRRGDYYQQSYVSGMSVDAATAACVGNGGTLLTPVVDCGSPQYPYFCAQCCALRTSVGVAPIHHVDLSGIGTPPFRLGR